MIGIVIGEQGLKDLTENLNERNRNRVFKNSMRAAMNHWHFKILPKHFGRLQTALYPGTFPEFVNIRKSTPSMVDTGEFRDRILRNPIIRATFKGANIRYNFGRPAYANNRLSSFFKEINQDIKTMPEKTKRRIFGYMKGKKITFEEAKKQIVQRTAKRNTYSAKTQALFKRGITAVNRQDVEEIKSVMLENVFLELRGKKFRARQTRTA